MIDSIQSKQFPHPRIRGDFQRNLSSKGFTLIELMITVALIAIIAAVALPSYTNYVMESRRTEGRAMLLELATRMEKYRARFGVYTNDLSLLGYSGSSIDTENGYYSVTIRDNGGGGGACPIAGCFILDAKPMGPQLADEDCARFSLNSIGMKTAQNSSNTEVDDCW